jgi:hypothetical protein
MPQYRFIIGFIFILFSVSECIAQQGFGIGGMVGTPDGISIRKQAGSNSAFQGAVSFNLADDFSSLYLHGDLVWELDYNLGELEAGRLVPYAGVGAKIILRDDLDNVFGGRFPVGLLYDYDGIMDIFIETAPFLDIEPSVRISIAGAVGFRVYLGGN